jgi:4-hydroxy-tetrahydrodipicolinate synthase
MPTRRGIDFLNLWVECISRLTGTALQIVDPGQHPSHEPHNQDMKTIIGSIVALATPMHEDGSVDYPALRKLVDWHIAEGTDCIGVVGTTGESPTVNVEEHCEIIRVAVEQAKKRVPIMAGCGANSTSEAIELARFAKQVGADCQLQVVPYYNKPTQEGQYRHFKAIAEAVGDLPTILYNVPGRSVADMLHATVLRLTQVPGIVGIKEATGDIGRAQWLIKEVPKGFAVYSGDDPTAVALMLCGGQGNISVTANVAPRLMHELCMAAVAGDARRAMELQFKLLALHKNLFIEANPIPVKWAMTRMGLCGGTMRLPMTPLETSNEAAVESALRSCGLI